MKLLLDFVVFLVRGKMLTDTDLLFEFHLSSLNCTLCQSKHLDFLSSLFNSAVLAADWLENI